MRADTRAGPGGVPFPAAIPEGSPTRGHPRLRPPMTCSLRRARCARRLRAAPSSAVAATRSHRRERRGQHAQISVTKPHDRDGRSVPTDRLHVRGIRRLCERDSVPMRVGDVHVAHAVRVGLDRFVLDALSSQAFEEHVETIDREGDPARARLLRVRLDEEGACSSMSHSTSSPTRMSAGRPKKRVYQSMLTSRSDTGTPGQAA
jgi:hypothetical protein